jgi:hypothetical protein
MFPIHGAPPASRINRAENFTSLSVQFSRSRSPPAGIQLLYRLGVLVYDELEETVSRFAKLGRYDGDDAPQAAPHSNSIPQPSKVHLIKNRAQVLDAEIKAAKGVASNGDDYHSVWTALVEMALQEEGAFTGITDAKKGIEYTKAAGSKAYFSKDALRKRMNPAAR